jgi:hypothetical protein
VPETAVDEHCYAPMHEYDVRPDPAQASFDCHMLAVAQTPTEQERSKSLLGAGVA